ncbi:MAG: cell division protein FtsW [Tissierellia bacterium]|nr:cell division protein FtsW [Tissierellia bacterium]
MKKAKSDKVLFIATVVLIIIGVLMVFSASGPYSSKTYNNPYRIIIKHMKSLLIGSVAMFIGYKVNIKILKKISPYLFLLTIILCCLVYTPIGYELNYARRWIKVAGITVMPSDYLKAGAILYVARYIEKNYKRLKTFRYGFVFMLIFIIVPGGLIYKQPDLSTTIAYAGTIVVMFLVSGIDLKPTISLILLSIPAIAIFSIKKSSSQYSRMSRVKAVLNPLKYFNDEGWQLSQSLFAISTGSILGLGIGKSRQKFLYLSEAHNDFIFAIICEEMGFIGGALVIGLFLTIIYRGMKIAFEVDDIYSKVLAVGIVTITGLQAFINIATVLGLIPPTGIVLPFISYGGSSLMVFMGLIGILLNISKQRNI